MIDIHAHIIYNVDDGSDALEKSIAMLKYGEEAGITDIICTPHYTGKGKYDFNNEGVEDNFETLKKASKEAGININLYLGNEIRVSNDICETLNDGIASRMNSSRYMLIEFPIELDAPYAEDTVYELCIRGIVPIIAHPERCYCFERQYGLAQKLVDAGALLQCNIGSLIGYYGEHAKSIIKLLLEDNLVHFIATDIHSIRNNKYEELGSMLHKLKNIVGEKRLEELTVTNPRKVINNEEI